MLFASTPADKAILPTAWGGRYFFNRISQKGTVTPLAQEQPSKSSHLDIPAMIAKWYFLPHKWKTGTRNVGF
ncbi:hypothetical protein IPC448_33345 [Pseudomonas aeruginosa]|nr:hypothetical protein IPC448_33345 [Pseudomonas aeruginosa]